jgi:coenzyme Q-binding protein COQ10
MRTVDQLRMRTSPARVFRAAADVEQWPLLLRHYRWVHVLDRDAECTVVEMAAWRPFGPLRYPTWWVSEMWIDQLAGTIRYRHIRGITRGMDVVWHIQPSGNETDVSIVHEWQGPAWPVVGAAAAKLVIGPVFIHGIASLTLAGIARHVESVGQSVRRSGRR